MKNILFLFTLISFHLFSQTENPAEGTYTKQDKVMTIMMELKMF